MKIKNVTSKLLMGCAFTVISCYAADDDFEAQLQAVLRASQEEANAERALAAQVQRDYEAAAEARRVREQAEATELREVLRQIEENERLEAQERAQEEEDLLARILTESQEEAEHQHGQVLAEDEAELMRILAESEAEEQLRRQRERDAYEDQKDLAIANSIAQEYEEELEMRRQIAEFERQQQEVGQAEENDIEAQIQAFMAESERQEEDRLRLEVAQREQEEAAFAESAREYNELLAEQRAQEEAAVAESEELFRLYELAKQDEAQYEAPKPAAEELPAQSNVDIPMPPAQLPEHVVVDVPKPAASADFLAQIRVRKQLKTASQDQIEREDAERKQRFDARRIADLEEQMRAIQAQINDIDNIRRQQGANLTSQQPQRAHHLLELRARQNAEREALIERHKTDSRPYVAKQNELRDLALRFDAERADLQNIQKEDAQRQIAEMDAMRNQQDSLRAQLPALQNAIREIKYPVLEQRAIYNGAADSFVDTLKKLGKDDSDDSDSSSDSEWE